MMYQFSFLHYIEFNNYLFRQANSQKKMFLVFLKLKDFLSHVIKMLTLKEDKNSPFNYFEYQFNSLIWFHVWYSKFFCERLLEVFLKVFYDKIVMIVSYHVKFVKTIFKQIMVCYLEFVKSVFITSYFQIKTSLYFQL